METEYMRLRVGKCLINVYRRPTTYFASVYGQLPIPFNGGDSLEQESLIDLIMAITETYCKGNQLEIYDETTETWSNF